MPGSHETDDIIFGPEDPFDRLDGFDPDWPFRSVSILKPRLYYVRLFETQPTGASEEAALRLGHRLSEGHYKGLIMDYRQAEIAHEYGGFEAVANAFGHSFPRQLLMVYIHDEDNYVFAHQMLTLLRERGVKVARTSTWDAAVDALMGQMG